MVVQYRQLEAPMQVDTSTPDTGGAAAAASLSRAFKTFEGVVSDIGMSNMKDAGQKAGALAGGSGNPNFISGWKSQTAYAQAYNSSAEAAYVAKRNTDLETSISKYEQDYEANLDGYNAVSQKFGEQFIKDAPPEMRTQISQMVSKRVAVGAIRVRGQQIDKDRNQHVADIVESQASATKTALDIAEHAATPAEGDAAIASAIADNANQYAALVKDNALHPVQAQKLHAEFIQHMDAALTARRTSGVVENMMNQARVNVEAGDALLASAQANPNLTPADKLAVQKEYEQQRNLLTYERSRTYATDSAGLAKDLAAGAFGNATESRIHKLYQKGAISVDEYQSSMASAARNEKQHIVDTSDTDAVRLAMQSGQGLDPADPAQRKAVDKVFTTSAAVDGISPGDPRWQAAAIEWAHKTNILPASAESWARVNLLSGDPAQAVAGAAFFGRVKDANPSAWDYQKDTRIGPFAEQVNANMKAGVDPTRAYELAHFNVYEMAEPQKAVLMEKYKTEKVARGNESALQDSLNSDDRFDPSIWSSSPEATSAMRGEYNALVAQYYPMTNGNVDQARSIAADAIRSTYGVSTVNGAKELLKFAPERMYPQVPVEIIRADISNVVKELGLSDPPNTVRLVPSSSTERTRGLAWNLGVYDEDGSHTVIRGPNNRPVDYVLPAGGDFRAARTTIAAGKIEAAKADRASWQERTHALQDALPDALSVYGAGAP